jgi:DNA-binding IclR family transcriptional regulator
MYTKSSTGEPLWKVNSVIKALKILELFTPANSELSLAQIGKMMDTPKSTLLNLLKTLESECYLYKVRNSQNYRLGFKLIELGYNMRSTLSIVPYAIPYMEDLQQLTGSNIYLTSHINGRVMYLEGVYNSRRASKYSIVGKTLPMHCTSSGKAMLSYMSEQQILEIIEKNGLSMSTPNTISDQKILFNELHTSRERGYAVDNEEETLGIRCVAIAVLDSSGYPVGALSISGSAMLLSDECIQNFLKPLSDSCLALSEYASYWPASQMA